MHTGRRPGNDVGPARVKRRGKAWRALQPRAVGIWLAIALGLTAGRTRAELTVADKTEISHALQGKGTFPFGKVYKADRSLGVRRGVVGCKPRSEQELMAARTRRQGEWHHHG